MTPPKLVRCAIYTRKSTEEGLEQAFNSLDAQREACEAYIKSQAGEGWVALPMAYDDGGFSGGNMERPGLRAMMQEIDRGGIDVVVVYKVDRLTRALSDFSKIVERFDKRGVSFVSVTQAFNTTTSMGRLTLNVLLSFAQFEREVTSERIRDKLAASRRKGMWMGGKAPFGYTFRDKKLHADETDAETVRRMFRRYLELKSVRLLRDEFEQQGIISKAWISRHGHARGGVPFNRGALYHLLQNRIYIGEIEHKDERHKGQHDGIVPRDLFDAVQDQLADARRRETGPQRSTVRHLLTGLIFDDQGTRMSPTHGQKNGRRYRYYVSRSVLAAPNTRRANVARIPAEPIEELVLDRIQRLAMPAIAGEGLDRIPASQLRPIIDRVDIRKDEIVIRLHAALLHLQIAAVSPRSITKPPDLASLSRKIDEADDLTEDGEMIVLTVAAGPVRRGGSTVVETSDGSNTLRKLQHDLTLLKAIAKAHRWLAMLVVGECGTVEDVAERESVQPRYVRRILQLAFLSPEELKRALQGDPLPHISVNVTATQPLALGWPA